MGKNIVYGRKGEVTYRRAEMVAANKEGGPNLKLRLETLKVVILHPSLCIPLIRPTEISTKTPLSIFILADQGFYDSFRKDADRNGDEAGPRIKDLINYFLKIESWDAQRGQNKNLRQGGNPLFSDNAAANRNIACTYLGHLGADGWKIWDKHRHPFACIRSSARDHYLRKGIIYGFQIDIIGGLSLSAALYDASWVIRDAEKKCLEREFLEVQDVETTEFLQKKGQFLKPYKFGEGQSFLDFNAIDDRPVQSHHPICLTDKPQLNLGHLTDVHVSSRQHIFQKSGAQMLQQADAAISPKLGSMVNASAHTLKELMDRLGGELNVDLLVFTGDLIDYTRNYDPAARPISKTGEIWEAMLVDHYNDPKKYPEGIDNIIMYSLFLYWYDTYKKPILLVSGNHEAYTLPYGISPRVKPLKAIGDNVKNKGTDKAVDQLVDESIKDRNKEWADREKAGYKTNTTRANEGIPADHNLTIAEAILLYGPDYNRVTMTGGGKGSYKNFKLANLEWFYTVFTPFSDFVLTYKTQSFIGLGWGDDEKFTGLGIDGHVESPFYGGFLPRAPESLNGRQKTLVDKALARKPGCAVLLSHFTLANYGSNKPLGEIGEINCNDFLGQWSDADHGTFEQNRSELYGHLAEGRIHLSLSGHSHRSGLYQPESFKSSVGRKTMTVKARASQPPQQNGSVRSYQAINSGQAKIIVSASGGPIPKQNYTGELFNWGMERPSGTLVRFNGSDAQVSLVEAKTPQAKPRFAVAWDYADIFGKEKTRTGVFRKFESDASETSFMIELNPELKLPDIDLIAGIDLYHYTEVPPKKLPLTVSYLGQYRYKGVLGHSEKNYIEERLLKNKKPLFLCLRFKPILGSQKGFQQYDFASPWNMQIEWIKRAQIVQEEYEEQMKFHASLDETGMAAAYQYKQMVERMKQARGVVIRRHSKNGEVPDHMKLSERDPEYAFDWKKYKKK